jgi:Phosphoglucomutase/phosphomannomutase, alpha/beta/alpha domain I
MIALQWRGTRDTQCSCYAAMLLCWRRYKRQLHGCRVQSTFNALGGEIKGKTLALGGDGRYFNKQAAQIIIKLAAGNGLKKVSDRLSPVSVHALLNPWRY